MKSVLQEKPMTDLEAAAAINWINAMRDRGFVFQLKADGADPRNFAIRTEGDDCSLKIVASILPKRKHETSRTNVTLSLDTKFG
jgi:hypothetical protein